VVARYAYGNGNKNSKNNHGQLSRGADQ